MNTLAALAIATPLAASAPSPVALALVAAFSASAFAAAAAGTFLGAPSEDSAASALPAHALLSEGRGFEAVALSAVGTFFGLALGLALAAAARYALGAPLGLFNLVRAGMPWLLLAVAAALVLSEPTRVRYRREPLGDRSGRVHLRVEGPLSRPLGVLLALAVFLAAGVLGLLAFRLGASSPVGLPAPTPLLPLLAGLFGAPGLVATLLSRAPGARAQIVSRPRIPPRGPASISAGAGAGSLVGLLPGLTAAPAASVAFAARPSAGPEESLLTLGAVNGAGVAFTLLAWIAFARPRSGALAAAGSVSPVAPWTFVAPPAQTLAYAAAALAAACGGYFLALATARGLSRFHGRVPERPLAAAVLAGLVVAVGAFTGPLGLLELATAVAIGLLPLRWGLRRSHCLGVILVPVLARLWA